jgi:nitroreductase
MPDKKENARLARSISDLVLYSQGAVGFEKRPIPDGTLKMILKSVTPYSSLCKWKLVYVLDEKDRRRTFEAMQKEYKKRGHVKWAETMNRWKIAPVMLVFCMPESVGGFVGVPEDVMRPMALIELGCGVQSLIMTARACGAETHWIASALMLDEIIKKQLHIPEDYEIVFFGVAGYPAEIISQDFPPLEDVCYPEKWKQ